MALVGIWGRVKNVVCFNVGAPAFRPGELESGKRGALAPGYADLPLKLAREYVSESGNYFAVAR